MLLNLIGVFLGLEGSYPWLAQTYDPNLVRPEDAALVFSGPRFFIALIAGIVLAFGFQLLLTNLSVAAGITYLGHQSDSSHSGRSEGGSNPVRKIGTAVGLWTLITVSLALFLACLLAVKLSLVNSALLGGIVGLVIWGAYFSLLVWISSTTVGSLVGSVVNAAVSGFQALIGTATTAMGAKVARDQIVTTAEAAAAAVRREFTAGIDPQTLRENLEDYLDKIRPKELDIQPIRQEFERLLSSPDLQNLDPEQLQQFDRATFEKLIGDRTYLSKREVNQIVDQLEATWKQTVGKTQRPNALNQLVEYLQSARPEQISEGINSRLDQLIAQLGNQSQPQGQSQPQNQGGMSFTPGMIMSQALNALIGIAMGRTDLSDLDVEKIINQVKTTRDRLGEQASKVATQIVGEKPAAPYSVIRADVENYLLNAYSWQMTPERIDQDFRAVLYDPEANATAIRKELEQLSRQDFVDLLQSRGIFTQDRMTQLSAQLEAIRRDVLRKVTHVEETEKTLELETNLQAYLHLAPRETLLDQNALAQELKPILDDPEVEAGRLHDRLQILSQSLLMDFLAPRSDLSQPEKEQVIAEIGRVARIVLADAEGVQSAVTARVQSQWQQVTDYLRDTGKAELNPEGIQRDLQTLLHDPQAGVLHLRSRLSQFDRSTLVTLLSQRNDISESEANRIVDQVESTWHRVSHAPQILTAKATEQYDKVTTALSDYLRNTGRTELNPEAIQRDLKLLLQDPKLGTRALRDRLSHIDRETLVKLLSQRQDLSEAQVNQIIDQVQGIIRNTVRAPRRLAVRAQTQLHDFQSGLADYLRNTGKDELNPEGIRRDLNLLLHDPRLGMSRLSDRLSHLDRSTLVALLAQRQDMTEEEANQIVDRVLSVREQMLEQIKSIQLRIQNVIDSIFNQIRDYLNGLQRPELNYDGIKRDLRTLFDDPQAGVEALRTRLSQFDRNTLIALLSSREDMSEADAEHIIHQVERARDSVLNRASWVQEQVQQRLDEVKYQAQRQVEETRKAAASAAWWLFATALTSAILSTLAGGLAVVR
jgi:nucleoid DNA-binding protein